MISADETIGDDLYLAGENITIDGVINGDVVAFGKTVRINGKVNGSLFAAAQTIVIEGTVSGSARMAGSVMYLGEKAKVSGDILGVGYSLELRKGATTGRDVVYAGGQLLIAGQVTRNLTVATGGLELDGSVGGDVRAKVGEVGKTTTGPMFMPQPAVAAPSVARGLTIDPKAKIQGNLDYTQSKELAIPAGVVAGKITLDKRDINEAAPEGRDRNWLGVFLRSLIALIVVALVLLVLFPRLVNETAGNVLSAPGRSLLSGLLAFGVFLLSVLVLVVATVCAALLFGVLTLGSLSAAIIGVGLFSIFGVILAFVLIAAFIAKIVVGVALGQWILRTTNSSLAANRFAPAIVGVTIIALVLALLCLSFIPGIIGSLISFAITLFGLGALWIRFRPRRQITL